MAPGRAANLARSRATGPQGWQDRLGAPARVPEDGPRILTPRNPETWRLQHGGRLLSLPSYLYEQALIPSRVGTRQNPLFSKQNALRTLRIFAIVGRLTMPRMLRRSPPPLPTPSSGSGGARTLRPIRTLFFCCRPRSAPVSATDVKRFQEYP